MARHIDLKTVGRREKLRPRASKEPYWQPLSAGHYLGYRPSAVSAAGAWLARHYDATTGKRPSKSLGDYRTLPPSQRFAAAKRDAEFWFAHLDSGGTPEAVTVADACRRYAADRPEIAARFARYVYPSALARVPLAKLSDRHVRAWREHLATTPARTTHGTRAPASLNRDMSALRAALNAALDRREVLNDHAWRVALRAIRNAGGRRNLYLDRDQRKALLAALPADVAAFARGLCLLPLRPGALAGLRVGDFDARRKELTIARDKAGTGRKILLPTETAALLSEQARSKHPAAPLFTRADGRPWSRDAWKRPIKAAARAAGLPEATTAYTLRHSTITDLVQGGLDLLTIAQVSGTSLLMIEKHYGHLRREHAARALAGLML